jgi:hypothetical protein
MNELVKAIKLLKPTSEFRLVGNDYSNIEWIVLDGDAPTEVEITEAIERVKAEEINEVQSRATQRQAILDRLGITAEEAALLLS